MIFSAVTSAKVTGFNFNSNTVILPICNFNIGTYTLKRAKDDNVYMTLRWKTRRPLLNVVCYGLNKGPCHSLFVVKSRSIMLEYVGTNSIIFLTIMLKAYANMSHYVHRDLMLTCHLLAGPSIKHIYLHVD